MAEAVTVNILNVTSRDAPPATQLEYEVCNEGDVPVWLVDDGWLIWSQNGKQIELSYKRGKMRPGSHVFGYFPPEVVAIKPGGSVRRTVELEWPQRLDLLWNTEQVAAPPPGEYQVSVRIGYGLTPKPPEPDKDVEMSVLGWQKEAVSQPVSMIVPSY